jgi:acyl-CoA synthetase (AMP-forming)/AMP-acid ligase II
VGLPDDRWTELICAVIVPRAGQQPTADDITAFAAAHLAAYKKPRRVVFMAEVPKNLTGRVLKTQLVEQVLALPKPDTKETA